MRVNSKLEMTENLPLILQSGYFTPMRSKSNVNVNQTSRALTVVCELCRQKNIDSKVTGYNKSIINFKRHLKVSISYFNHFFWLLLN